MGPGGHGDIHRRGFQEDSRRECVIGEGSGEEGGAVGNEMRQHFRGVINVTRELDGMAFPKESCPVFLR